MSPTPNNDYIETDELDNLEEPLELYTERETNLVYEAKFFEGFVLVRPASPAFYRLINKMDLVTFAERFDDFHGDRELVREYLRGASIPETVTTQ